MKSLRGPVSLVVVAAAAALFVACPLPFQYNGKGATDSPSTDPSSPNMTAPVIVSYTDQGGASGTIADGGSFTSGQTTTVTLSTTSLNAVIFYTTNGLSLTNLRSAQKIDGSSGTFTVTRMTTAQTLDVYAVAVGPNMLPSAPVHVVVTVSPYPIMTITRSVASMSEDNGTATFTVISSVAPSTTPITVNLMPSGTYHEPLLSGIPTAKGTAFPVTIGVQQTTTTVTINAHTDPDNLNETITLSIVADSGNPQTYSVGGSSAASVVIQDNNTPVITITAAPTAIPDSGGVTTFQVTSTFALNTPLTVNLVTGGNYRPGDQTGLPSQGSTFTEILPAGQTSLSFAVTAQPDLADTLDHLLTVSLVADSAYGIGQASSASVTLTDTSPVLTVTAAPAIILDNGGTTVFTVTASHSQAIPLTVNLATGGNYKPGDQTGLPSQGSTFTEILPAGQTSLSFAVTAQPDLGDFLDQLLTVSLVADGAYVIGQSPSASVTVTDTSPILIVTAAPTTISDNGGTTVFTVTSSRAQPGPLTVNLVTSGNYKPGDQTGLPNQGQGFALTLPAGQTSVTQSVTAHPDIGDYNNQAFTVSLAANPTYGIGTPASASVTVIDSSPVGTVTLTGTSSAVSDAVATTIGVVTTVPPEAPLTVNLSWTGATPGLVTVPSTVVIPAGARSATFVMTPIPQANYVLAPVVSVAPGPGYVIGSPGSLSFIISDAAYPLTGLWDFGGGLGSAVGGGSAWLPTGGVSLVGNALNFPGGYQVNYAYTDVSNVLNQNQFTLGISFTAANFSVTHSIICGGFASRWLTVITDTAGHLIVEFNNHSVPVATYTITAGTQHTLLVSYNASTATAITRLDGVQITTPLPGFTWNGSDLLLISDDGSMGLGFAGQWYWVYVANSVLN